MSLLTKTSRCLLASELSTHVGSAPLSCFPSAVALNCLCLGDGFACFLPLADYAASPTSAVGAP
jgi:hypothetical protein